MSLMLKDTEYRINPVHGSFRWLLKNGTIFINDKKSSSTVINNNNNDNDNDKDYISNYINNNIHANITSTNMLPRTTASTIKLYHWLQQQQQ